MVDIWSIALTIAGFIGVITKNHRIRIVSISIMVLISIARMCGLLSESSATESSAWQKDAHVSLDVSSTSIATASIEMEGRYILKENRQFDDS